MTSSFPLENHLTATTASEIEQDDLGGKKRGHRAELGQPLGDLLCKKIQLFSFLSIEYSAHYPVSKEVNKDESFSCCYALDHRITSTSSKRRKTFSHSGTRVSLMEDLIVRSSPRPSVFSASMQPAINTKQRIKISSKSRTPPSARRVSLINRLRS
ncbi:hypothetical protein K493DRAFT_315982, partial [Basidiobolus meristosporus CBS 931.73]